MKLTAKEMIRLQKETHLFEHGFYDEEILKWWAKKTYTSISEDEFGGMFFYGELTKWGENFRDYPYDKHIKSKVKIMWFKQKFPEFFEADK